MRKPLLMGAALIALALSLGGCAGWSRGWSSWSNGAFGADWIVVQFDMTGKPFNCWRLQDTSVGNEEHSDGIYWQEKDGHLVHLSGWYNRVQVARGEWDGAAKILGVDLNKCGSGRYVQ